MDNVFNNIGASFGTKKLNNSAGINRDIIEAVNSSFIEAVKQNKNISADFKGNTPLETCLNIWNFLRTEIFYKKDPEGYQFIKQPRKFLEDKSGDCKSFSLFTAAVLKNIYPKANIYLRYASYSFVNIPTHVYTIYQDEKETIIIDAVYNKFNKQKKFNFKIDYKMKVYTLAGIEDFETINGKGKIKAAIRKATGKSPQQQAANSGHKTIKDKIKGVIKKTITGGKKVGFAPSRAAFLGLVLLNIKGLATKILLSSKEHPEELKTKWLKVGGDYNQLIKSATTGASRKAIGDLDEEIGSLTAVATSLSAAAPIIIFFTDLFKKLKGKGATEGGTSADLETISNNDLEAEGLTKADARAAAETPETGSGILPTMEPKTMMLIGGGTLALLLLMKKGKKK